MNSPSLSKWAKAQKKKEATSHFIESGLLGGSMASYYMYRLKFFLVRTVVAALIFAIEIKILITGLGMDAFSYALGPRVLVGLLSGYWWASLEEMRSEIRQQKREEKSYLIPRIILTWRKFSWRLSEYSALIGLLGIAVAIILFPENAKGPLVLYWLSLVVRMSVEFPLRTYHSSVYATRRIYRPLLAILLTELLSLALFLTLKPTIGAWSVGISALIGLSATTIITYYYTTKTFNYLGYNKGIEELKNKPKPTFGLPSYFKILKEGLPLSLFKFDSIIALLLIVSYAKYPNTTFTLATLAVCMPVLQAAQEWSQLLYFDYKKLELKSHYWLKQRFEAGLVYVALILSLFLWCLTPILTRAVGDSWNWPTWQLLVLFISASLCGQQAMRIFSTGSQKDLFYWGTTILIGMSITFFMSNQDIGIENTFLVISLVMLISTAGMVLFSKDKTVETFDPIMPPTQWLWVLKKQKIVWGGIIELNPDDPSEGSLPKGNKFTRSLVASEIGRWSKRSILVTTLTPHKILFFSKIKPNSKEPTESLINNVVTKMPHIIKSVSHFPENLTPTQLLLKLKEKEPKLSYCFAPLNGSAPQKENSKPLKEVFLDMFPNGVFIDLSEKRESLNLPNSECRNILSAALRYHKNLGLGQDPFCKTWDVTSKDNKGTLTQIFAAPKPVEYNRLREWRKLICSSNLYSAWHNG